MGKFDFKAIEEKWRKEWEDTTLYQTEEDSKRDKKYVLVEFPYPSGSGLHVGHAFTMTGSDIYARFCRMSGNNVLFPMGWDAFGLPTENYAIRNKIKPQDATAENVAKYKEQMNRLAFSFDWSREVNTTDSNYYKWTQWIFIQLFKHGLAYKEEMPINWCPSCKTGLANEEVIDGKCERCGAGVYRKNLSQWIVKITEYADKLIDGLEKTDFVEKVKSAQINWIDRSEGAEVDFKIDGADKNLKVFTTRPDTLFGATFMVIAPEHDFVSTLIQNQEIKKYVEESRKKSELERSELQKNKTGVFTGFYAINPVNEVRIPIWISDFVLASYGTGAIMSVPAHDERDFDFAKKYKLPIIPVIEPSIDWNFEEQAYTDVKEGILINSDILNGLNVEQAKTKIIDWLKEKSIGKVSVNYHLRDWIFSRQHYWGEPIPMINCEKCGWVPEKEENLPIKLPEVEQYEPTENGESPLSNIRNWVETVCPVCGGKAERETDTMPNWAGSDWYFLRYIDPSNDNSIADWDKMEKWLPVDVYVGGDEHNTLHLLYSRFIVNFLYDIKAVPVAEPYYKRLSHGVILGPDGQRMSKSRGNVVVPDVVADRYGVDVTRTYLMFMGPFTGTMAWNEKTLVGVKRFLDRFYSFAKNNLEPSVVVDDRDLIVALNKTIKKVGEDINAFHFNTAVAALMEMLNKFEKKGLVSTGSLRSMVKVISPFAPYIAEELWQEVNGFDEWTKENSVHVQPWPEYDESLIVDETVTIGIQVNGKVRGDVTVGIDEEESLVKDKVLTEKNVIKHLEGKEIVKFIYVPGKIVNIVAK